MKNAIAAIGSISLILALSACKSEPTAEDRMREAQQAMDEANANYAASMAKVGEIDRGIASLTRRHAEDPAKMNQLISQCQAETGAEVEGEGALSITNCVNARW